jgi:hypothetical protein
MICIFNYYSYAITLSSHNAARRNSKTIKTDQLREGPRSSQTIASE